MGSEENPVVKAMLSIMPLYGITCWRNNQVRVPGRRFNGKKGVGDVIGYTNKGTFVNGEGKKPGGAPSGDQIDFMSNASSSGCIVILVETVDELVRELEKLKAAGKI